MVAGNDSTPLASELRIVLGRLMRRLRTQHGFPLTPGAVLGRLDRDGPQSVGDLATAENIRSQSMGQTLTELEADGLISRRPDERDRRRTMIELTPAGRAALYEDRARRDGWLSQAIANRLTDDERRVLGEAVVLLARLSECDR